MVPQHNVTRPAFQTTFRDISPRIKNIEALPGFCLVPPREQGDNHPSSGGQERPETDIPVLLLPERKQRGCRLLERNHAVVARVKIGRGIIIVQLLLVTQVIFIAFLHMFREIWSG